MAEDRDQNTEQPTDKKLREAREKGQIPRSRDLSGALVIAAGLATLGGGTLLGLGGWLRNSIVAAGHVTATHDIPLHLAVEAVTPFKLLAGCFLAMFLAGIIGQLVPGGWNLSAKALLPDFKRVNPFANVRNMFTRGPAELVKTLLKAVVVGAAVYGFVRLQGNHLQALSFEAPSTAIHDILAFAIKVAVAGTAGLVLVGMLDAPYQWWQTRRDQRMSKQEVRDELRETEGKPEVKGKLRQLQQQMARGRMIQAVQDADVVVVNPIHVAVALSYKPGSMKAPKLVAKGAGEIAERIRDAAREHHVPLLVAPPLARAIYRTTRLDGDVPASLYRAVAQVLAWVYQLHAGNARVQEPDIELPPDLSDAARPWT
ncbi:MAG TPA: flagellar type III secretion system protein FlhB [Nevskiaceae bacterium]|nr:flagellar type III secretion system protein FlhB [Nevskiaceae bacterium]